MFFGVTVVFMFACELYLADGAIVGSSSKQHVNNLLKNEHIKHPIIHGTPEFAHVEITTNQPDHSHVAKNDITKKIRTPIKIALPPLHKKDSTEIKDPLAQDMQSKASHKDVHSITHLEVKTPQNILKQEVPKPQKKLYHHITLEDIRQRRKELREKWQARHNRLALETPRGLHNKNEEQMKVSSKHLTIPHNLNKLETEKPTPKEFIKKRMHLDIPHPNIYEQVTPRTRRILEHKEDAHKEPLYSSKYKQLFSARSNAGTPSTFMIMKKTTEYIPAETLAGRVSEEHSASTYPSNSDQPTKEPTESNLNPNCTDFSVKPDSMKTTASSTSTPTMVGEVSTKEDKISSTSNPHETEAIKLLDEDTKSDDESNYSMNSRQGDVRPFGYGPSLDELKNPIPLFNINPLIFTTASPKVGSIKSLDEKTKKSGPSTNSRQGDVRPFGYGPFLDEIVNPVALYDISPISSSTSSPKMGSMKSLDENTKESNSPVKSRGSFGFGPTLDEIVNPVALYDISPISTSTSSSKVGSIKTVHEDVESEEAFSSAITSGPKESPIPTSTPSSIVGSIKSLDENTKESKSSVKSRGSFGFGPSLDDIVNPVALYDISPISTSTSSPKVGSIKTVHEDVQSKEVVSSAITSDPKESPSISTSSSSSKVGSIKSLDENTKESKSSVKSRGSFGFRPSLDEIVNPVALYDISPISTSTSSPKVGSIKTVHEDVQSEGVVSSAITSGPKESPISTSSSSSKVGSIKSLDENTKESKSSVKSRGSFGFGPSLDEIVNPVALYDISPISTSTSSPKVGSIKTVHEDEQSEEAFSAAITSGPKESSISTSASSPKVGSIKTVHEDIQPEEVLSSGTTSSPKERSVARKTTTVTTESSRDDVVSVKIDPYDFTVEVYTEKIDTPPFYRNLTFHERLLHDKPVFIYGKSAEQVGVTEISEKKEVDSAKINVHSQIKHGKRSSVHTTKTAEGNSMKISEDSSVHQDWRENLRKAIKERLRKLTRDSGEKRLL